MRRYNLTPVNKLAAKPAVREVREVREVLASEGVAKDSHIATQAKATLFIWGLIAGAVTIATVVNLVF